MRKGEEEAHFVVTFYCTATLRVTGQVRLIVVARTPFIGRGRAHSPNTHEMMLFFSLRRDARSFCWSIDITWQTWGTGVFNSLWKAKTDEALAAALRE